MRNPVEEFDSAPTRNEESILNGKSRGDGSSRYNTFEKKKEEERQKKEITAFRRSVLNYIYLTFIVPFQFKFVFYE